MGIHVGFCRDLWNRLHLAVFKFQCCGKTDAWEKVQDIAKKAFDQISDQDPGGRLWREIEVRAIHEYQSISKEKQDPEEIIAWAVEVIKFEFLPEIASSTPIEFKSKDNIVLKEGKLNPYFENEKLNILSQQMHEDLHAGSCTIKSFTRLMCEKYRPSFLEIIANKYDKSELIGAGADDWQEFAEAFVRVQKDGRFLEAITQSIVEFRGSGSSLAMNGIAFFQHFENVKLLAENHKMEQEQL